MTNENNKYKITIYYEITERSDDHLSDGKTIRKRGRPFKALSAYRTDIPPRNGVYYTVPEAVELLGVHRHTLQARLRDGTLKGKQISGEWRIYKDSLYVPDQEEPKGDYT